MSDTEPLFALLEIMLRTFTAPKVKPGGHSEEIFVNLSDEEREEFECAICYQILKDVRLCENKHKFCYSCIYVWSTSGSPINHGRCPVCRVDGLYESNVELDERINKKRVKCALKSCKWSGQLKLLGSHQHQTYPLANRRVAQAPEADEERVTDLPVLRQSSSRVSPSPASISANATGNQARAAAGTPSTENALGNAVASTRSQGSSSTTSRPSPRRHITATGLTTSRVTNRARIQNTGETVTPRTPRPPAVPRPNGSRPRRIPTLPSIVHPNNPTTSTNNSSTTSTSNAGTTSTNNASSNTTITISDNNNNTTTDTISADAETETREISLAMPQRRRYAADTAQAQRLNSRQGFTSIRDRLNESRTRLDALMTAFTVEIDRGRQDLTEFQQERERRRQEQLDEVRELGRRLGHVAQELRGLLTQRRHIRDQIDRLVEDSD